MNFETAVHVRRPLEAVFDYLADPLNFPQWNSAVQAVHKTSAGPPEVGSTYSMARRLPSGRAENQLEVVARTRPEEFALRTTSGPTPFLYRYSLASEDGETDVRLAATIEAEGILALLGPLATTAVKKGVDDNLATLKQIIERAA
jgi:carbon monoxide dehydrogenase subunit G